MRKFLFLTLCFLALTGVVASGINHAYKSGFNDGEVVANYLELTSSYVALKVLRKNGSDLGKTIEFHEGVLELTIPIHRYLAENTSFLAEFIDGAEGRVNTEYYRALKEYLLEYPREDKGKQNRLIKDIEWLIENEPNAF